MNARNIITAIAAALLLASTMAAQPRLVSQRIKPDRGAAFTLNVADGFEIIRAIDGMRRPRFLTNAPDGRIFVTDLFEPGDNRKGSIFILDGFDEQSGKFKRLTRYLSGLRNPNSCQFYKDADGQWWLYIAETQKLTRRKFTLGENAPTDNKPQVIATFPDYGESYKIGGWHLTRTITFSQDGMLYVSVGSSCNVCVEKASEPERGTVLIMNPDGSGKRVFAKGLRNAVGIRAIGDSVFVTEQGSDHLGPQKPDETFYKLQDGGDYGWPYCHSSNGKIFADPKFKRPGQCKNVLAPYAFFPAHASALGFDRFDDPDTDASIKGSFLVALHGSSDKNLRRGYKIVIMREGKAPQDLVNGFLSKGSVLGRPCDIMKLGANSFLFTDDDRGVVYLVRKKGTHPAIPRAAAD